MGVGLWFLAQLEPTSTSTYIVLSLVVMGGGVAMFSTPNSSAMMGAVSQGQRAVASGILATNRNIGMSVGVALSTALFAHFQIVNQALGDPGIVFVESYRPVIYVGMGFAFGAMIFSLIRSNKHDPQPLTEKG